MIFKYYPYIPKKDIINRIKGNNLDIILIKRFAWLPTFIRYDNRGRRVIAWLRFYYDQYVYFIDDGRWYNNEDSAILSKKEVKGKVIKTL